MSRPHCSLRQEEFTFGKLKEAYSKCLVPTVKHGSMMVWATVVVQYSVDPIITLHGRITGSEYVGSSINQVHPITQMLHPSNDAVCEEGNDPIHTGTVQSWFEGHEDELQHLPCSAQSSDLNSIKPLWSVLETSEEQVSTSNICKVTWRCS
jgi:hypothetical protein